MGSPLPMLRSARRTLAGPGDTFRFAAFDRGRASRIARHVRAILFPSELCPMPPATFRLDAMETVNTGGKVSEPGQVDLTPQRYRRHDYADVTRAFCNARGLTAAGLDARINAELAAWSAEHRPRALRQTVRSPLRSRRSRRASSRARGSRRGRARSPGRQDDPEPPARLSVARVVHTFAKSCPAGERPMAFGAPRPSQPIDRGGVRRGVKNECLGLASHEARPTCHFVPGVVAA